ncbi:MULTISPECIES: hypothetical protein [Clostridium]|uniref:Uncharacterized protein n=1 Tax=Clostridium thermobutyricum TaxID=29372 RepID=N9W5R6_9CLOT|nr:MULTISPECIES: hypothetical protein [Clostridium]ELC8423393.1 hypothetical protein [Clostridium perfringens]ELC8451688.1 hypothetical protein [Clostridium perfringens]ENY98345.1 hypothetical protein HMPREF1092_03366 [Clostridium thermobutyricum]MCF2687328.1 hypothetical protein [Clostridium perfringens]
MKKISSKNLKTISTICFLIAGILSIFDKRYIIGILFILLTISYIIALISENKKKK